MGLILTNGPGIVSSLFNKVRTATTKKSPEILVATGTALFVVTLVSMHRSTLKNKETVDLANDEIKAIENTPKNDEYTEEQAAEDIMEVKKRSRRQIIRDSVGTVLLAGGTIACFWGADAIRKYRHAALFASAEMTRRSFEEYRKNTVARFGQEADAQIRHKLSEKEWEEEEVNPETGKKKKVKKKAYVSNLDTHNSMDRCFDKCNDLFEPGQSAYNLDVLIRKQAEANEMLRNRGFVTLNDVYDLLHYERTREGQFAAWIYDPNDPSCVNNQHIDFGFWDKDSESARRFMFGYGDAVWLNFDVDTLDIWSDFDDYPKIGISRKKRWNKYER